MRCRECTLAEDLAEKEELLTEAEERADENERLLVQCWHSVPRAEQVKLMREEPGLAEIVEVTE